MDEKLTVDESCSSNFSHRTPRFNSFTTHILLKNDRNEAPFVALYSKMLRVCLGTSPLSYCICLVYCLTRSFTIQLKNITLLILQFNECMYSNACILDAIYFKHLLLYSTLSHYWNSCIGHNKDIFIYVDCWYLPFFCYFPFVWYKNYIKMVGLTRCKASANR